LERLYLEPCAGRELGRIFAAMRRSFRRYERMPAPLLRLALRRRAQECLVLRGAGGELLGYAFCCIRSAYGYVLINYLEILPAWRGRGLGSRVLAELAERYREKQGLIVELTCSPGEEADIRRRERFYARAGYEPVDRAYALLDVEARLMVRPLRGTARIAPAAHLILPEIYAHTITRRGAERLLRFDGAKN